MATHHPMDRLHGHLDKVTHHAAQVAADASQAVAAHDAQRDAERRNGVRETLTKNGR